MLEDGREAQIRLEGNELVAYLPEGDDRPEEYLSVIQFGA